MLKTADLKNFFKKHPEFNLIPEDKTSVINRKLMKGHRTEADWTIIRNHFKRTIFTVFRFPACENGI